ncbi:predicted transcriptional regulators [Lachnospiraceae bacterium KM106-2]|nr:predicted transcriptional regulators [Lachnospiraceae bacterium KM106-2]
MGQYKVGQLSKVMGVTSHTIKHYEKFNLVAPVKDQENNYRYYDMRQFNRILESKIYRNIGFPLKDISEIMNECDNEAFKVKLVEHKKKLKREIELLQQQYELASAFYKESQEIDEKMGQWFVQPCPKMLFYRQTENDEVMMEESIDHVVSSFMEQIPKALPTLFIDGSSFSSNRLSYSWGIAKEYSEEDKGIEDYCEVIESFRGFVSYIRVKIPYIGKGHRLLEIIKEKYKEFSTGDIPRAYLLQYKMLNENSEEYHYFKVLIPLE